MKMKLIVGTRHLGEQATDLQALELSNGDETVGLFDVAELSKPQLGMLAPYLSQIVEVVVAFGHQADVNFLRLLPEVTDLWCMTSSVKDLVGLRFCKSIRRLSLERVTARLEVLGELNSLEELFVDNWKPGAESIFRLAKLRKVGIQKYGLTDLQNLSGWTVLEELWLHAGRLRSLKGIPGSVKTLRLTNLKELDSLKPLLDCPNLESLSLDVCRKVHSLEGIENCKRLKVLSIGKGGSVASLEPLRSLGELNHIFLADDTEVSPEGIEALYHLPALGKLIISKRTGLDKDRLLKNCSGCSVVLAR
jgi:hypothetical protein